MTLFELFALLCIGAVTLTSFTIFLLVVAIFRYLKNRTNKLGK